MSIKALEDFELHEVASEEIINKYKDIIPEQLLEVWKSHGFGSFLNGYLKTINPDEFMELVDETCTVKKNLIPLFATAMGDIIVLADVEYIRILKYRRGLIDSVSKGFKYFFEDLSDKYVLDNVLDWNPFMDAYAVLGRPTYEECYGYVPLLGLGGPEKFENLRRMDLQVHLQIISDLVGPIDDWADV